MSPVAPNRHALGRQGERVAEHSARIWIARVYLIEIQVDHMNAQWCRGAYGRRHRGLTWSKWAEGQPRDSQRCVLLSEASRPSAVGAGLGAATWVESAPIAPEAAAVPERPFGAIPGPRLRPGLAMPTPQTKTPAQASTI